MARFAEAVHEWARVLFCILIKKITFVLQAYMRY
jgi:hypothetical protein